MSLQRLVGDELEVGILSRDPRKAYFEGRHSSLTSSSVERHCRPLVSPAGELQVRYNKTVMM